MRQYEAVYILDPTLEEDQQNTLVERFQTLIANQGGEVQHIDRWERRRLAYEVKGRREGCYVVMNFKGEPAAEAELGRVLGITEGVLRHLIVKMDERKAEHAIAEVKAAAEAKARVQAEARAAAEEAGASAAPVSPALEEVGSEPTQGRESGSAEERTGTEE